MWRAAANHSLRSETPSAYPRQKHRRAVLADFYVGVFRVDVRSGQFDSAHGHAVEQGTVHTVLRSVAVYLHAHETVERRVVELKGMHPRVVHIDQRIRQSPALELAVFEAHSPIPREAMGLRRVLKRVDHDAAICDAAEVAVLEPVVALVEEGIEAQSHTVRPRVPADQPLDMVRTGVPAVECEVVPRAK